MNKKLKPLKEQVIVITGASSGIGLVTARTAAKRGAKVVLAARNESAIQQAAEEIVAAGGKAIAVTADVGKEDDVNRIAAEAIAAFGGFDTWANNAGVSIFGHTTDVTVPDMRQMFDTNFWGVVYGSRAAVKHFTEKGTAGAIINTGSFFGDSAVVLQSTYAASKHAVHGWTAAQRMELEKQKLPISITLLHPGRIDTPYNEHARSYIPQQPAHRGMLYPPESVAEAILYAAAHPKRDIFIGSQSKLLVVASALFPRLMDKFMELYAYPTQHSSRPSRSREDNALYEAGYGLHERGTHEGYVRKGSVYVTATKHPVASAVVVGAVAAGLFALNKLRSAKA